MTIDKEFIKKLPVIKFIHQEKIELNSPFIDVVEKFAMDDGMVALLSGGDLDCSRYHILAVKPWLELTGTGDNLKLAVNNKSIELKEDPFFIVDELIKHFHLSSIPLPGPAPALPVISGLFGYFSYDLKNRVENLPQTCIGTELPDICLYAPSAVLIHDKEQNDTNLLIPCLNIGLDTTSDNYIDKVRDYFFKKFLGKTPEKNEHENSPINRTSLKSTFSKNEYIEKVKQVIEYLKAGDIYQANLSQRFETDFAGNSFNLFRKLYKKNPASFFAYINAKNHQILSTSPERFIQQDGRKIETRPIKGTIARGRTKKEDKENAAALSSSIKDDAELTMIVDLMRNDLSRVADAESIIVDEHKKLEPYDNVFHLVSIVKGLLSKDKTSIDLLKASFPGGSITGCPKIRAMEIIDELEPIQRHVYTGSIGYISFHDTMDLSIAIRTATIFNKKISFSVGGGIVFDSDPEKEYQETLDKGKTIMDTLSSKISNVNKTNHVDSKTEKVWVNGKIINKDEACISVDCPGFQYGAGLFETIKAENGKIIRLSDHIKRLNKGLKQLFDTDPLNINFEDIIKAVLEKNDLNSSTAAVKLMLAKNDKNSEFPFFVAVFAKKYIHRLDLLKKDGIELTQYPYPRLTPIADHKSLNYLYYYLAGLFAKENNKDEALILNPDNTISETNTCNIVIIQDDTAILPQSEHVLEGVTLNAVINLLEQKNYKIKQRKIFSSELFSYSNIFLTNALMGAVPVISIADSKIKYSKKLLEMINSNIVGF